METMKVPCALVVNRKQGACETCAALRRIRHTGQQM